MMRRIKIVTRGMVLMFMAAVLAVCDPVIVLAAPVSGDEEHKGDVNYYTHNGIIFYDGGKLYCSGGSAISGGAAAMLQKQKGLDPQWVPVILNEAKRAGADPIAMASLLFWENRGFPKYGAPGGGSDTIGRGPWQITRSTWPSGAGPYDSGVIDPIVSTTVAADLVKNWGGIAGSPIGSIDQDFGKGKNIPSMATVAKNYNAGRATWREPGVAGFKAPGRVWKQPSGTWFAQKQTIIDDYIMAMTYAYYLIATGESLPPKGQVNNDGFVQKGLENAQKIKDFKITDGGNVANDCAAGTGEGGGNIVETAKGLSWPHRKFAGQDRKSAAKQSFQIAMPKIQGDNTANSVIGGKTAWSDCGVFVATTMRLSGADPKYALRSTGVQLDYTRKHPELYNVFRFENMSQLKPGDVFIINDSSAGHTYIHGTPYKGEDGKDWDGYSASWGSRVPMANNTAGSARGYNYWVASLKAAPANPAPTAGGPVAQ